MNISGISKEITTTFTSLASGKVRIDMNHTSGLNKSVTISELHSKGFAAAMQANMVSTIAEWIAAWRVMEDMTFWIADKDDEGRIAGGGFNEIDNLIEVVGHNVIYGPAHFTDE